MTLLTIAEYWGNLYKYSRRSTGILSFAVFFFFPEMYNIKCGQANYFTLPKKIKEKSSFSLC